MPPRKPPHSIPDSPARQASRTLFVIPTSGTTPSLLPLSFRPKGGICSPPAAPILRRCPPESAAKASRTISSSWTLPASLPCSSPTCWNRSPRPNSNVYRPTSIYYCAGTPARTSHPSATPMKSSPATSANPSSPPKPFSQPRTAWGRPPPSIQRSPAPQKTPEAPHPPTPHIPPKPLSFRPKGGIRSPPAAPMPQAPTSHESRKARPPHLKRPVPRQPPPTRSAAPCPPLTSLTSARALDSLASPSISGLPTFAPL
jgi:hypothetical protein